MRNRKTATILLLSCMTASALLAGCSDKKENSEASASVSPKGSASASAAPKSMKMMLPLFSANAPSNDNPALKEIQAYTNSKIELTWVPDSAYNDKVNTSIASGALPDAIVVLETKSQSIVNAARSGMFWEIGPYLKKFPNLAKLSPQVLNNISIDGKVYGIYRSRPLARGGMMIRQDWLDNLGLKQPDSMESLYEVIKAFTKNDPDKDGKDDTVGMLESKSLTGFPQVLTYFGGPKGWQVKDGKFTPEFMTPAFMDTLKFYKKLYDEKLMNSDFAAITGTQMFDYMNSEKGGMAINVLDDAGGRFTVLQKANPKAVIDVISRFKGPDGNYHMAATTGHNGEIMFPKSSVKTEQQLLDLLGIIDKLGDPTMLDLFAWGLEGVTYKKENGVPVITDQASYDTQVNPLLQLLPYGTTAATPGNDAPVVKKYKKMMMDNEAIAIPNPAEPFISETMNKNGSELNQLINDGKIKYIMGAIDDAGWNQIIATWKKNGGDNVIADYEAAYAKANAK
ncbi:extracellular solute-binding protein [Paenibacillus oryzisoli]|uniref:extracellular solute-binding protein n=1 Tax=Paenibacillus oryzisoli TaxID=1850517 RepID=UPI003D26F6A3